ncbi:helix-turn-helix domain-containing protein [Prescottella agglutinans]|uniref:Transcriptional regulator with XRE-family HTH domain n=1 Tax=Prescottella agglutinans TaxID=1644129 RepID=A0ABT6M581_9NOCA|nr:helix-turn-helix transcriptional regulator [Prescottella agglutinans]MDH6279478.1 transcriptional regulator with XRE-family HTH domain [Prescottella agglutinans]
MTRRGDAQESNPVARMTEQERGAWARRIKPVRVERGLTQKDVAEMAGVSRNTVVGAETGTTIPQADKLWRIMVALDLGTDPEDTYPEWVQEWISVIAPLIQAIPQPPRNEIMTEVVMLLGNAAAGNTFRFNSGDTRETVEARAARAFRAIGATDAADTTASIHELPTRPIPDFDFDDLDVVAHEPEDDPADPDDADDHDWIP